MTEIRYGSVWWWVALTARFVFGVGLWAWGMMALVDALRDRQLTQRFGLVMWAASCVTVAALDLILVFRAVMSLQQ